MLAYHHSCCQNQVSPGDITGQNYKFCAFYASGIQYSVFNVSDFGFRVSGSRFQVPGYIVNTVKLLLITEYRLPGTILQVKLTAARISGLLMKIA